MADSERDFEYHEKSLVALRRNGSRKQTMGKIWSRS